MDVVVVVVFPGLAETNVKNDTLKNRWKHMCPKDG